MTNNINKCQNYIDNPNSFNMKKQILILLLSSFILSCGGKEKNQNQSESNEIELIQEIDSIEAATKELKSTEESIEASIKKLDDMLNEI